MKAALIIMTILFLLLLGFGLYYFYFHLMPMQSDLERLTEENLALEQQVAKLTEEKQEKEKQIDTVTNTYQDLITDMKQEIEDGQIKISELAGKLKVNIVDKILFDSGEATVSAKGKKILARVGNILKQDTTKIIRVEGHTDNVKIKGRLQKMFPTNWELSTSRATNVVRFLQESSQIEGSRLEAVGYSEYKPVASNQTTKGRSQNRRIEIILVPK